MNTHTEISEPKSSKSTTEKSFFIAFLVMALVGWIFGMIGLQLEEAKIRDQIFMQQKTERDLINSQWALLSSKGWTDYDSQFKYKKQVLSECKRDRDCAQFAIISKFNCNSVRVELEFIREEKVVDTDIESEGFVSSLQSFNMYFEASDNIDTEFVEFASIECLGGNNS